MMYNVSYQGLPVASYMFKNDTGLVVMLEPNRTLTVWRTSKGEKHEEQAAGKRKHIIY
jgi:hypothetical protein